MQTSLTDQLFATKQPKSLTDQLFESGQGKSLTDQLFGSEPIDKEMFPDVMAASHKQPVEAKKFYTDTAASPFGVMTSGISAYMGKMGYGPKPEGGWSEAGVPLGIEGKPYNEVGKDKIGNALSETIKGFSTLAMHPMETIKGGLEFATAIPGFLVGVMGAISRTGKEIIDQLALGNTLDLDAAYTAASKGMAEGIEFFQPGQELLLGEPTPESQLVGQIVMSPMNAISALGQAGASWEGFNNYPNIRGALKFTADISGLATMGMLLHSSRGRAKLAQDLEGVTKSATDIMRKEQEVQGITNDVVRQIQQKILEVEKAALEKRAAEIAKTVGEDTLIKEDIYRQAERLALEKTFPVAKTGLKKPTKAAVKKLFEKEVVVEEKGEVPKVERRKKEFPEFITSEQEKGMRYLGYTDDYVAITSPRDAAYIIETGRKPTDVDTSKRSPKEGKVKAEPSKPTEVPYKGSIVNEAHEVFDAIGMDSKYKKMKSFRVIEHTVQPGEPIDIPATWHDAVFRQTVARMPDGTLEVGEGGSYDTILWQGSMVDGTLRPGLGAAAARKGSIPPGATLYILDVGGEGTVAKTRTLRIYRAASETGKIGGVKEVPRIEGPKLPTEPYGEFIGYRDALRGGGQIPMYRIRGGKLNNEVVTGKRIEQLGIKYDKSDVVEEAPKTEPITDLDRSTGTTVPGLDGESSPFFQTREETDAFAKIYNSEDRAKAVAGDPELFTQKLINDVNRWYKGDKAVDIVKTRDGLSKLATRADELRSEFISGANHLMWKDTVSDAAAWARKLDRSKIEPSGGGTKLNIMIPLDELPSAVIKFFAKGKDITKNIFDTVRSDEMYRNEKLWKETGFWLGRDGFWRFEIDPSKAKFKLDTIIKQEEGKVGSIRKWSDKLVNVLEYPELYKNVPMLKETRIVFDKELRGYEGVFEPETNTIRIKYSNNRKVLEHEMQHGVNRAVGSEFKGSSVETEKNILLDEMLHVIKKNVTDPEVLKEVNKTIELNDKLNTKLSPQSATEHMEVLAYQRNKRDYEVIRQSLKDLFSKKPLEEYKKDPGEMEARLAEIRMGMDAGERKIIPPWETLDDMLVDEGLAPMTPGKLNQYGGAYDLSVGTKLYSGVDPTAIKKMFKGWHGTSSKYIKPHKIVGEYLKPKSMKQIIEDTLDELNLQGKERDNAREEIYSKDYFSSSINKEEFTRPFEGKGEVYVASDYETAADYANWAGEAYDNALIALGALEKNPNELAKKVKKVYEMNRNAVPFVLEVETPRELGRGDNKFAEPIKVTGVYYGPTKTKLYSGIPIDEIIGTVKKVLQRTDLEKLRELGWSWKSASLEQQPTGTLANSMWRMIEPTKDIKRPVILIPPEGRKLYSGLPLDKAAQEIIAGARKLAEYTKKARGMKAFKPGVAAKMLREEFNRSFIDRSGNIRGGLLDVLGEEGYKTIQQAYLAKGASSRSANMLKQMSKEVYDGLSKREKQVLDNLILADRMTDIGRYKTPKQFKFPEGTDPKSSVAYSELVGELEKLSPTKVADLRNRVESYFQWMKKPLQDLLDNGLITEQEYNDLASHNYRRLKLVDVYDKSYKTKIGKKIRTVYDSGVEALARGRDTDIFEPSSEVMALEVFNRTYGRVMNNKANANLLEIARNTPDNPFVRVKEARTDVIPTGWNRIFMYEKGERKALYLSPEMSKEWINSSPEMSYKASQVLRYASASPLLRTFATGINWGFAAANLPRDIMHTWFTARTFKDGEWSSVYSPTAPVFALQIGRDLATTFTDAVTKGKRYQDYINEGGGMEFLVHQGRLFQRGRHLEGSIDKFYNFMGYFGETSEIMTRLAIRDRVIRNRAKEKGISYDEAYKDKDITREATFAARDYMDFGQGGGITKAADNALPYLNAAVQGTRGLIRSFKPGSGTALSSTYRLAQLAALTTGTYIAFKAQAPSTMKNLEGDIATQNNLCIPMGDQFSFEDDRGQTRYIYYKIPLDPGQKFFKVFFEAAADKWLGNEVDVDRVTEALKETSPVGISQLPPTMAATLGYMTNKNFWRNEDIWKKTDKTFTYPHSKEEYIPGKTSQAFIDLGAATGLSPERTKYAVEQLVTGGTVWSYLAGKGYEELLGDLPKSKKEQHIAMVLAKTPVIKRFFGVTNPYSKYAGAIDKEEEGSVLKNFVENRELDRLAEGHLYEGSVDRNELFNYIDSFPDRDIQDRLRERFKFQEATKDLPERSFWLRLQGVRTDARARVFVDRLEKLDDKERDQIWTEYAIMSKAGGVITPKFRDEIKKAYESR